MEVLTYRMFQTTNILIVLNMFINTHRATRVLSRHFLEALLKHTVGWGCLPYFTLRRPRCLSYPGKRTRSRSARSPRHRRTLRPAPSTRPQHYSACEVDCRPAACCGGRTFPSQAPGRWAPPQRAWPGTMPNRGWWPGTGGRRWTRP